MFPGGRDSPHVIHEADRLLDQFSRGPSRPPKRSLTPVTHGHTTFHLGEANDKWQTPRSEAHNIAAIPIRRSPSTHTYANTAPQDRVTTASRSLPRQSPTRPSTGDQAIAQSLRKNATVTNASKNKAKKIQPTKAATEYWSQVSPSSSPSEYESSSSASQSGHPTRRSSRSTTKPTNYYAPIRLGSDEESVLGSRVSKERRAPYNSDPPTIPPTRPRPQQTLPPILPRRSNVQKLLFGRELGQWDCQRRINAEATSDFKPWKSWKGASNDVNALAWSPDGTQFAAGATAQTDEYNRGNNLILGDLQASSLKELPNHWIPRPESSNVNDQRLFMTVSAMQWSGQRLYTASYDHTVKIWDVATHKNASCLQTLRHDSKVVVMAPSSDDPNILATGTRSFGIWDTRDLQNPGFTSLPIYHDPRQKSDIDYEATILSWGHTSATKHFLVGGMEERNSGASGVSFKGHLGLWQARESSFEAVKLTPNTHNVFDVKWHPLLPIFAAAGPVSPHDITQKGLPRGTKSIVRVYDPGKCRPTTELVSQALDVNEVTFCPLNPNYVTASCTNGVTYVWDQRNQNEVLHALQHGEPLNPINEGASREEEDVGVRVALWGSTMDQLYTGSSDGALNRWDIRRAPDDVLVEHTASFEDGIMCGAFSEDQSHLLVGDSGGGIHVLATGPSSDPDASNFAFERAPEPSPLQKTTESGVSIANQFLASRQLVRHEIYGVGQGPSYEGPFASWARDVPPDSSLEHMKQTPLRQEFQIRQLHGQPVENRGLDDDSQRDIMKHIRLAQIRNVRLNRGDGPSLDKRKRESSVIELSSGDDEASKKSRKKKQLLPSEPLITDTGHVDLTQDSSSDRDSTRGSIFINPKNGRPKTSHRKSRSAVREMRRQKELEMIQEKLEEDYWWPASGDIDPNFQDETV
ncbi:hypothetical protein NUU61_002467 [Penicillium alfredii]|uniref:WD40 repeat-like protein n=1 Tax=Penicillium alfredii TaxID=1506179 RepID=A0A9W9KG22_9EURO|nr:uncharacterized protein NUU61_002467 [Penicillium alfredii]KAJ5105120.1 hypothetical protein NUU61_002467 [Penicillium alfredii]